MKAILVLFCVLVANCYAAHKIVGLIEKEVHAIMAADPALTVDHCTTKCDALFDLVDHGDEHFTDRICKVTCQCVITGQHCHPTNAPHTTMQPHHSHHGHTTTPGPTTIPTTTPPPTIFP